MNRRRLLIILGAVLGLVAVSIIICLVLGVIGSGGEDGGGGIGGLISPPTPTPFVPESLEPEKTEVWVALQPIGRNQEFASGSIGQRDWPITNVPPDVIADEAEVVGKVARTEIVPGQIILRSMLKDKFGEASEAAFEIEPGHVAVAIPIDRQISVAYAIKEGDYVDVLISAEFIDVDEEFQSKLPNKFRFISVTTEKDDQGLPTGNYTLELSEEIQKGRLEVENEDFPGYDFPSEEQRPRRVAQLTVQHAKVLKVGEWIEVAVPGPAPAPVDEEAPPPTATPVPPPDIVTLSVTPQDALVLMWTRQAQVYYEFALRAAGDEHAEYATEAVTLQYMLTRFKIAVPPKLEYDVEKYFTTPVVEEVATPEY